MSSQPTASPTSPARAMVAASRTHGPARAHHLDAARPAIAAAIRERAQARPIRATDTRARDVASLTDLACTPAGIDAYAAPLWRSGSRAVANAGPAALRVSLERALRHALTVRSHEASETAGRARCAGMIAAFALAALTLGCSSPVPECPPGCTAYSVPSHDPAAPDPVWGCRDAHGIECPQDATVVVDGGAR